MELYTLDPLLRRIELFEDYESLIWTDRYRQHGDFEMKIASTYKTRSILKADTLVATDKSRRVMRIETVEDERDSENRRTLTVKGRSLEVLMYDRVAKESLSDLTTSPVWTIAELTATDAARKIFHDICVDGVLSIHDIIPFIHEGTFAETSNIPEPVDLVTVEIAPTTVYDAIVQLADIWDFGFRILREGDSSKLWFDIYTGSDRTTKQTVLPPVVFSPQLDNLQNTKELTTIEGAKNVAYVYSPAGFQMVYAPDVDPDVSGFERRVIVVDANDVTEESVLDVEETLIRRGREALAQAKTFQAFDGEISQSNTYRAGIDYNVGDLITMADSDGVSNDMRITELISACDREGSRSYPTLSVYKFINTGSWLSWNNSKMWSELGPEEWVELP